MKKDAPPKIRTESDYIDAEFHLSQAMGLHPKKFKADVAAPDSTIIGTWVGRGGTPLPAWARDNGAAFSVMVRYELFPAGGIGNDTLFIQWGIDLESLIEQLAQHSSKEAALRYAVTVAATEYLNHRPRSAI